MNFQEFPLAPAILQAIEALGFTEPTPVQEEVIPFLLDPESSDLVGLSQTGTGKTAAFGLPLLHLLDYAVSGPQVLILCPTRELCMQIGRDMTSFARFMPDPGLAVVYGGAAYGPQITLLRRGARVIIATPGRLRDLMEKGEVNFSRLRFLVLDEADTMLNMGFKEELDEILTGIPAGRRTLLFSATMPPEVSRIAESYMNKPEEITLGMKNAGAVTIEHRYFMVHARDKFLALKRLADYYPDIYGIVFCRTRIDARDLAEKLVKEGYNADALHGDLSQQLRESIMEKFRTRSLRILVATDIAARGLDVHDLTHVIHYDLPDEIEIYNHRSGRTGRAGKSGMSLSIINMRERNKIRRIEQLVRKKITETPVPGGREICEQQLLHLVERIRSVDIDETLIGPYLPIISEMLTGMDRDEIVKKVVSLEFNRFLHYYGTAADLSPVAPPARRKERVPPSYGAGFARELGESRRDSRWDSRREDRPPRDSFRAADDRRTGQKERRPYRDDNQAEGFAWLTLNLGAKDQFGKKDLFGLINRCLPDDRITLGKIVSEQTFTRFQVPAEESGQVAAALGRMSVFGKRLRIKESTLPPHPYAHVGGYRQPGQPAGKARYAGNRKRNKQR